MKISLLVDLVSILEVLVTNQHDNGSGGNEDTHSDELSQSQAGQADIGGQRQNDEDQNQNSLQGLGVHLQGGLFIDIGELKQQTTVDTVARDEQIKRLTELQDFIRSQPAELTEFDDTLVRRWFKQITIFEDHYTVELKSGLKVDIDAE